MKILLTLVLFVSLSQIGYCYQCFECNGMSASSCGVEFDDETTNVKNCEGDCLKIRFQTNGETTYKRDCSTGDGCEQVKLDLGLKDISCQTCSGNYCNNGP